MRVHDLTVMPPDAFRPAVWACVWLLATSAVAAQTPPTNEAAQPTPRTTAPQATDALLPDTVLDPPGGPRLIRLAAPGSALTVLRLSIPVTEGPLEAGSAFILQTLGLDRARAAAAPLGARVEGSRTPWGIAYTVVGPSEDFDYLVYVLREAVAEPRPDAVTFERARSRAGEEAARLRETAAGRLAAELRAAAVPSALPLAGMPASLDRLTSTMVRELWRRTHRREAMSLVWVGSEPVELVLASIQSIGSGARPDAVSAERPPEQPTPPDTEVLRHWYGEARVAGDVRDPHSAVVAVLIARRLRELQSAFEADVQLWDVDDARVLAIMGAAYPAAAPLLRSRLEGIVAGVATTEHEEIVSAVAWLRFELLAVSRTPWGLAAQVGRYHDATGDPGAAHRHAQALQRVGPDSLRRYVEELHQQSPARVEVRP